QLFLYAGRRTMRNHRALVIGNAAQQHRDCHAERRERDSEEAGALEHMRQQHPEKRKAGDSDHRGDEAQQDRGGDPSAQPARQLPQPLIELHQRTFSSRLAVRSMSLRVRGSSTSMVRCSVGRGVAVTMLTPFGAWKRCQVFCGTTTVMPALTSWLSRPVSV